MPRRAKNPKVGPATLRALRGPDDQGRYRYRLEWWPAGARGKMMTRALGWHTKASAMKLAAQAVGAGLPTTAPPVAHAVLVDTVRDLLEFWVARQEDRGDLDEDTKRISRQAGIHLTRTIGHVRLDRLGQAELEHHRDARMREEKPGAPMTVQHELRQLRSAWKWGRAVGLAPEKDLPTVRLNAKPVREKHTPSPADVAATIAHARPRYRLLLTLMWSTGARVGELLALDWAHVDLERGVVELDGKTGTRFVPLTRRVRAMLEAVEDKSGRLLAVSRGSVTSAISDACKAAGVKRWSPHGLRRLAVDEMARAGVDIGTAAAVTGHDPKTMLTFYRKATAGDMALAVQLARLGYAPEGKVIKMRGGEE